MTNTNRTIVASAVNAAWTLSVDGETVHGLLKRLSSTPIEYEFGLFADQDIRACMSMFYTLMYQLVGLMPYEDRPLQDTPKDGSLDANDTGATNERELACEEAINDCLHGVACIYRHLQSLDERARKELEEAGSRTTDGGRFRFNLKQRVYKSIVKSPEEVLLDMKSKEPVSNVRRHAQIDLALDLNIPHVTETDAAQAFMDYMDPDRLEAGSHRAAQAVVDTLVDLDEPIMRYEQRMQTLNEELAEANALRNAADRKIARDSVTSRMVLARNEYRQDSNYLLWLLKQRLAPVALMAHTSGNNAISELINSPEWRAAEAKQRAAEAKVQVIEAQAQMVELEAQMLEMEANKALFQARQQMLAMQKAMAKQMAEFKELTQPQKPAKQPKQPKQPKEAKQVKQVKAEPKQDKAEPLSSGIRTLTTRGRATSFVPRG